MRCPTDMKTVTISFDIQSLMSKVLKKKRKQKKIFYDISAKMSVETTQHMEGKHCMVHTVIYNR